MKKKTLFDHVYEHRFRIGEALFFLWLICIIYWLFRFPDIVAHPFEKFTVIDKIKDADDEGLTARAALTFIFWFATSGIFVVAAVIYALAFIRNIIFDLTKGAVPNKYHHLIAPALLLLSLWPCFNYQQEVKSAILTVRAQGIEIVSMAMGFDIKLKRKSPADMAVTDSDKSDLKNVKDALNESR
ncbi:hypothetical protein [Candidatus Magnetomonas plexicatena]|uniref:hypothetical protein n=1 Tax=Candidatus Magnetomonas plexicatena TaxID=2552947 RepID=UPI001102F29F|nr:hypothetical protein E2O03_010085 [Nitrospirales bacterium LBB_01]